MNITSKSIVGILAKNHPMYKVSKEEKGKMVESGKLIARAIFARLVIDNDIKVVTVLRKA